jgi:hypothetical protein
LSGASSLACGLYTSYSRTIWIAESVVRRAWTFWARIVPSMLGVGELRCLFGFWDGGGFRVAAIWEGGLVVTASVVVGLCMPSIIHPFFNARPYFELSTSMHRLRGTVHPIQVLHTSANFHIHSNNCARNVVRLLERSFTPPLMVTPYARQRSAYEYLQPPTRCRCELTHRICALAKA